MARTSDELELFEFLIAGSFEKPMWRRFLDKLREMTASQYAGLTYRSPGRPFDETIALNSSVTDWEPYDENPGRFPTVEPPFDETLAEGRPYSLGELLGDRLDPQTRPYVEFLAQNAVSDVRVMRVQEESGVVAWITLVRADEGQFGESDNELLRTCAPFLRATMRHHIALERERFGASLSAQAIRGMFGWLLLDHNGQILGCDDHGAELLERSGVVRRSSSGRLSATTSEVEREIYQALGRIADRPQTRPQAITLARNPWLDMLLVPASRKSVALRTKPAAIAYIHGDSWRASDRSEQLAQLFRLSPGEARLALALCRGMSIAEAAQDFGIAVGTARNYCKTIFAKTGARGQPDLVRIIMRSVLAIAPDI